MSTILLFILKLLFVGLHQRIIATRPPIDPALITVWARWAAADQDGAELPIATVGMLVFLVGTAAAAWFLARTRRRVLAIVAFVLGLLPAVVVFWRTRSTEFTPPDEPSTITLLLVVGGAILWGTHLLVGRIRGVFRGVAVVICAIALTVGIVLSLPAAAVVDYSYYIGPALKHWQGSPLGSFYMQYDLFGTLLFEGMMRLGFEMHQMQLVMALILAAWYGLYWLLILRLFRNRSVGLMLFVALVIVRFLNIQDHPAFVPQVLPQRMDMWVLLVLLAFHWGLDSLKTSFAFAVSYAFDSTFGFLAAGVYAVAVLVALLGRPETAGKRATFLRLATLATPIAAVAGRTAAGLRFDRLAGGVVLSRRELGFLPIASTSFFWPVALLVGWATATFVIHRDQPSSRWGLLICLFAVAQLTYFFGRSHDNNLLNVSSVWVFAIFLAIDQASELGPFAVPIGAVLVIFGRYHGDASVRAKVCSDSRSPRTRCLAREASRSKDRWTGIGLSHHQR
jgi:hypothetical protein